MSASSPSGQGERAELFARRISLLTWLLQRADRSKLGEDLAVYLLDLLDPVGFTVAHALRARCGHPDPAGAIRAAFGSTPPRRPLAFGVMGSSRLAEIVDPLAPLLAGVAAELRTPPRPLCARALVVAGIGAEVAPIHLLGLGQAVGPA